MKDLLRHIARMIRLLSLVGLMSLTACSDDSELDGGKTMTLEVVPGAQTYVEREPYAFTRDGESGDSGNSGESGETPTSPPWTPPTPYISYSELNSLFTHQVNSQTMGVFITKDETFKDDNNNDVNYVQTIFTKDTHNKWRSHLKKIDRGTYFIYGYSPTISSVSASIQPNSVFSDGAILTLNGLPSVTSNDVCVIVGAKAGSSETDDTGIVNGQSDGKHLKEGQFAVDFADVYLRPADQGAPSNFIFLLFDHLYSAMRLSFKVDPTYNALRTIRLKEIWMKAYNSNSVAMSRATAVITLAKTPDGSSPIQSINFQYTPNSGEANEPIYQSETGVDLNTEAQYFRGSFVPEGITKFGLICKYDVLDKKGNLVRENCTVENMLDLSDLFKRDMLARGYMYCVNLTLTPTYLYVMSESDEPGLDLVY